MSKFFCFFEKLRVSKFFLFYSATQDWEKEAKRKIRIEMNDPSMRRRRTIYDLNSYATSRPSVNDIWKFNTTQITTEPSKEIRYSASMVNISTCQRFILFSKLRIIELFKRKTLKEFNGIRGNYI